MVKYLITATMLAILAFAPMSVAQTADDMTPAVEQTCDDLDGALYGLCVAYCEAMDCDDGDHLASDRACDQVWNNYMAISGDEVMPLCPDYEQPIPNNEENDSDDTDDLG